MAASSIETVLSTMFGEIKATAISGLITAFTSGTLLDRVQSAGTFVEALEAAVAIVVPGVALAEVPTEILVAATVIVLAAWQQKKLPKLTLGDISENAGETQQSITDGRFGPGDAPYVEESDQ